MKKNLLLFFVFFLLLNFANAQTSYYYYQGKQSTITYSTRITFVHFLPNLTNQQKQTTISNAGLDLLNATTSGDIPDYVKLQSRITTGYYWVYPCAPVESRMQIKDSIKPDPNYVPPICGTCPNCTPYRVYYSNNNVESAISILSTDINVRSVSRGLFTSSDTTSVCVGTNENFYIQIKPGYTINDFSNLLKAYSLSSLDVSTTFGANTYKISAPREYTQYIISRADFFFETAKCTYATPNFVQFGHVAQTNDPWWTDQWALSNTGQYSGIQGADIRAVSAWTISKGANVKVAVVDNGFLEDQADLMPNIIPGINATTMGYGPGIHGTSVAGVIGAVADNGIDITGVAPQCKLMSARFYEDDVSAAALFDQAVIVINWAYQHGADILNCSFNLALPSDMIDAALQDASTLGRNGKGCVIVVAAGNYTSDYPNQSIKSPAKLPYAIAVGAMTMCNQRKTPTVCDPDQLEWGSCYGDNLSVVAPGVRIRTVAPTHYSYTAYSFEGTSAACPHVAGSAALMLSINPNLTKEDVRKRIELGSNKVGNYCYTWTTSHPNGAWNNEMGYGRLNAYNAVQLSRPGVTISDPVYNVAAQNSTAVTGNIGIIFNSLSCPTTLPFAVQFVKRYEVTTNITFPYTTNPVIICSGNGFNLANPNDGKRFAEAINVTNTSATLRTYIYFGYTSLGEELGWISSAPNTIMFTYCVVGSPSPIVFQTSSKGTGINANADSLAKIPFNLELDNNFKANDIPYEITKIGVSPNPVTRTLTLSLTSEADKVANIEIRNALGIKVKQFTQQHIHKGINSITFDVGFLPKGMYVMKSNSDTYKFLKN